MNSVQRCRRFLQIVKDLPLVPIKLESKITYPSILLIRHGQTALERWQFLKVGMVWEGGK